MVQRRRASSRAAAMSGPTASRPSWRWLLTYVKTPRGFRAIFGEDMRASLSVVCILASFSSVAIAGPKEEALAVLDEWTKAFAASDVDAIVKLNAPDALFMGTGSQTVVTDPAA